MSILDELTQKQRPKEFKSVQKALHSKDVAVRLGVLDKLKDLRYITEGACLPALIESFAPNKKILEYLVPAGQFLVDLLAQLAQDNFQDLEKHGIYQAMLALQEAADHAPLDDSMPAPSLACFQGLLQLLTFKEELKMPKMPKITKKNKDNPPPMPPMPVEQASYGDARRLALKALYYLCLPAMTFGQNASGPISKFQSLLGGVSEDILAILASVISFNVPIYLQAKQQAETGEATTEAVLKGVVAYQNSYYAISLLGFMSRIPSTQSQLFSSGLDPENTQNRQKLEALHALVPSLLQDSKLQAGTLQYLVSLSMQSAGIPSLVGLFDSVIDAHGSFSAQLQALNTQFLNENNATQALITAAQQAAANPGKKEAPKKEDPKKKKGEVDAAPVDPTPAGSPFDSIDTSAFDTPSDLSKAPVNMTAARQLARKWTLTHRLLLHLSRIVHNNHRNTRAESLLASLDASVCVHIAVDLADDLHLRFTQQEGLAVQRIAQGIHAALLSEVLFHNLLVPPPAATDNTTKPAASETPTVLGVFHQPLVYTQADESLHDLYTTPLALVHSLALLDETSPASHAPCRRTLLRSNCAALLLQWQASSASMHLLAPANTSSNTSAETETLSAACANTYAHYLQCLRAEGATERGEEGEDAEHSADATASVSMDSVGEYSLRRRYEELWRTRKIAELAVLELLSLPHAAPSLDPDTSQVNCEALCWLRHARDTPVFVPRRLSCAFPDPESKDVQELNPQRYLLLDDLPSLLADDSNTAAGEDNLCGFVQQLPRLLCLALAPSSTPSVSSEEVRDLDLGCRTLRLLSSVFGTPEEVRRPLWSLVPAAVQERLVSLVSHLLDHLLDHLLAQPAHLLDHTSSSSSDSTALHRNQEADKEGELRRFHTQAQHHLHATSSLEDVVFVHHGDPGVLEGVYDAFSCLELLLQVSRGSGGSAALSALKRLCCQSTASSVFHHVRFERIVALLHRLSSQTRETQEDVVAQCHDPRDLSFNRLQHLRPPLTLHQQVRGEVPSLPQPVGVCGDYAYHTIRSVAHSAADGHADAETGAEKAATVAVGAKYTLAGRGLHQRPNRLCSLLQPLVWDVLSLLCADYSTSSDAPSVEPALALSVAPRAFTSSPAASVAPPAKGKAAVAEVKDDANTNNSEEVALQIALRFSSIALASIVDLKAETNLSDLHLQTYAAPGRGHGVHVLHNLQRPRHRERMALQARDDVVCSCLSFLRQISAQNVFGLAAILESLVQALHASSTAPSSTTSSLMSHVVSQLVSLRRETSPRTASEAEDEGEDEEVRRRIAGFLSAHTSPSSSTVLWTRPRYFDEVYPAALRNGTNDTSLLSLCTPSAESEAEHGDVTSAAFLLDHAQLWPFVCLALPLLCLVQNAEHTSSLHLLALHTLEHLCLPPRHTSLLTTPSAHTGVLSDLLCTSFLGLGGAVALADILGRFGSLHPHTSAHTSSFSTEYARTSSARPLGLLRHLLSRGRERTDYWQQQAVLVPYEDPNAVIIDPKTGKPKVDKNSKDNKKNDNKKDAAAVAPPAGELLLKDVQWNLERTHALPRNQSSNNNAENTNNNAPPLEDPNHGPDIYFWARMLNVQAPAVYSLVHATSLLHTLLLGAADDPDAQEDPASGGLVEMILETSCGAHLLDLNLVESANGCTPLMYALLTGRRTAVHALLAAQVHEGVRCDVQARDFRGNPTVFYGLWTLPPNPSLHLLVQTQTSCQPPALYLAHPSVSPSPHYLLGHDTALTALLDHPSVTTSCQQSLSCTAPHRLDLSVRTSSLHHSLWHCALGTSSLHLLLGNLGAIHVQHRAFHFNNPPLIQRDARYDTPSNSFSASTSSPAPLLHYLATSHATSSLPSLAGEGEIEGVTPLMIAASRGDVDCARLLLRLQPQSSNALCSRGLHTLHYLASLAPSVVAPAQSEEVVPADEEEEAKRLVAFFDELLEASAQRPLLPHRTPSSTSSASVSTQKKTREERFARVFDPLSFSTSANAASASTASDETRRLSRADVLALSLRSPSRRAGGEVSEEVPETAEEVCRECSMLNLALAGPSLLESLFSPSNSTGGASAGHAIYDEILLHRLDVSGSDADAVDALKASEQTRRIALALHLLATSSLPSVSDTSSAVKRYGDLCRDFARCVVFSARSAQRERVLEEHERQLRRPQRIFASPALALGFHLLSAIHETKQTLRSSSPPTSDSSEEVSWSQLLLLSPSHTSSHSVPSTPSAVEIALAGGHLSVLYLFLRILISGGDVAQALDDVHAQHPLHYLSSEEVSEAVAPQQKTKRWRKEVADAPRVQERRRFAGLDATPFFTAEEVGEVVLQQSPDVLVRLCGHSQRISEDCARFLARLLHAPLSLPQTTQQVLNRDTSLPTHGLLGRCVHLCVLHDQPHLLRHLLLRNARCDLTCLASRAEQPQRKVGSVVAFVLRRLRQRSRRRRDAARTQGEDSDAVLWRDLLVEAKDRLDLTSSYALPEEVEDKAEEGNVVAEVLAPLFRPPSSSSSAAGSPEEVDEEVWGHMQWLVSLRRNDVVQVLLSPASTSSSASLYDRLRSVHAVAPKTLQLARSLVQDIVQLDEEGAEGGEVDVTVDALTLNADSGRANTNSDGDNLNKKIRDGYQREEQEEEDYENYGNQEAFDVENILDEDQEYQEEE